MHDEPHDSTGEHAVGENDHKRKRLDLDAVDGGETHRAFYASLAQVITDELNTRTINDEINACGDAAIELLNKDPQVALEIAHERLHTWPFRSVPLCWRRLYEEASLYVAAYLMGSSLTPHATSKRRKMRSCCKSECAMPVDLSQIVEALDMGIALSGQPHRKNLSRHVLDVLADNTTDIPSAWPDIETVHPAPIEGAQPDVKMPIEGAHSDVEMIAPAPFVVAQETIYPPPLGLAQLDVDSSPPATQAIARLAAPSFEQFQQHLDHTNQPLVMIGVLDQWPALELWKSPGYLLSRTIGGRRLVPVEIGQSYTDEDWTQRIMPFKEYLETYVLESKVHEIGYLAQHDLLSQIPALRRDIRIPDYCYTTPPAAPPTLPKRPAQLEEPQLNAWFGPEGTRSPLHTDPYCNILCQVVGYKYVRLYAPEETPHLYSRGVDESGVDMANTSQLNFSFAKRGSSMIDEFPALGRATCQEVILGPGQCLFIPAGWWHFIESLSISFSVSFWWN